MPDTEISIALLHIDLSMGLCSAVFLTSCKSTICAEIVDVAILIIWKWLLHQKTFGAVLSVVKANAQIIKIREIKLCKL
jgi:hypothetical protein